MLFPAEERKAELDQKKTSLRDFLRENKLDAYLISRHENIAWATAGLVEMRVAIPREVAVGSLLVTRDGGAYYLTTNNEAPRLAEEEFVHLDYEPVLQPWYASDVQAAVKKVVSGGNVASDDAANGLPVLSMKPLRLSLTDGEMARYRWLGQRVAEATTDTLLDLRPGMTEATMQSMISSRLLSERILPSVLLTAVDDRIRKYRHAVPRDGVLQKFGMLNFCARRWGLCISITRYVHFGALPMELDGKFAAVAHVNADLLQASREGASGGALFTVAQQAYTELGYTGEETMHHQGGPTGYWEREWVARPGGTERVLNRQALAWNPSLQGAKVEDTVVLRDGKIENLTKTPRLPIVETRQYGNTYESAGVLVM